MNKFIMVQLQQTTIISYSTYELIQRILELFLEYLLHSGMWCMPGVSRVGSKLSD